MIIQGAVLSYVFVNSRFANDLGAPRLSARRSTGKKNPDTSINTRMVDVIMPQERKQTRPDDPMLAVLSAHLDRQFRIRSPDDRYGKQRQIDN